MNSMSSTLYRKYRPFKFSEIIGQKHIVRTLSNAITNNRIGQAYLFTGPRGTGKTTLARIFAKTVNCTSLEKNTEGEASSEPCLKCANCKQLQENKSTDIIEIDAASNTGVDNIRDLRETAKLSPLQGKFKVYIIDEVHMLSQGAFNALLKILEEPPAHVIFILATTEIHKVPETIISRCQRFDFFKFTSEEIVKKLSNISKKEKIKIDKEALGLIAPMAEGGMRDAESLLEQTITLEKNNITAAKVEALLGVSGNQSIEKITELIFDKNISEALIFVNQIYRDGYNLEIFSKGWLEYLRKIMIIKVSPDLEKQIFSNVTKDQKEKIEEFSQKTTTQDILSFIEILSETIPKIKTAFIPQLPLEYAIVNLTEDTKNVFTESEDTLEDGSSKKQSDEVPKGKIATENPKLKKISTKNKKASLKTIIAKTLGNTASKSGGNKKSGRGEAAPVDIYAVKKVWKEIVSEIGKNNYSLSMILFNSKPIENSSRGIVDIVVKHSFHKDLVNKPENKLTIKDISNKITGLDFKVEAVTEAESGVKLRTVLPEEKPDQEKNTDKNEKDSQGSLLSDAMILMGGKVVEN